MCKSLGLSNFTTQAILNLYPFVKVKPTVNQIETHPYMTHKNMHDLCQKLKIVMIAYCPLLRGGKDQKQPLGDKIDYAGDAVLKQLAVKSGHWPLFRYNPNLRDVGENPFSLDRLRPTMKLEDYRKNEVRYQIMQRKDPEHAREVTDYAQSVAERKWQLYEELATRPNAPIAPHVEVVD